MKKIFAILSSALFLAAAGLFTACSTEDDLTAPTETWVEKTYTYKTETGSTELLCYFMFTENGYSNDNLQNVPEKSQNGSAKTIKPGLTVVIVPAVSATNAAADTLLSALGSTNFICKTFGMGNNSVGDDGEEDSSGFSFSMSKAKWNLFYYANIASFLKNDQLKNPPTPLKSSSYSELSVDEMKKYFSWKKLLANYLLGSL